jgi:regulator of RNase E activity RraA
MSTQASLEDIRRDFERVSPEVVEKASRFAASILADVAGRRGALDGRIAAVAPEMKLCGPAFTIEVRAGDNLMIHAAMTLAKPGDILVIDGKGDRTCALMGSIMLNACKALELGGVVIDAAVRDTLELRELGFPVFAVGSNPNGPTKFVPGRMNWPISCGGIAVSPGDLVVGDADGVVVIEREKAASLLDAAA